MLLWHRRRAAGVPRAELARLHRRGDQRQGLRERRRRPAVSRGGPAGRPRPVQQQEAATELLAGSFRDSFFRDGPPIATARAGNVIGGGDWSADRLIPDCVRALAAGTPVVLRYPAAVRPWQHVLEPLRGYLELAQALMRAPAGVPRAVNFGPDAASFRAVREVARRVQRALRRKSGLEAGPLRKSARIYRADSVVRACRALPRLVATLSRSGRRWHGPRTGTGLSRPGRTW